MTAPQHSHSQAVEWKPRLESVTYPDGQGPRVLVDAAHGNWHTIDARFRPFADLLRADGYRVTGTSETVSGTLLEPTDVFVISNAVLGGEDSEWHLPTPHALTDGEVKITVDWIADGGALLLIADHMPFPGSLTNLASALGVVFYNGFAMDAAAGTGTLVFDRSSGMLQGHEITDGSTPENRITAVKAYTGQGFRAVREVQPLLRLPDDWLILLPQVAWEFDERTPRVSAAGLLQGAVFQFGLGRVAVFGEAAMFTSQSFERDGRMVRVGFADPEAAQNARFVLNLMQWLSE